MRILLTTPDVLFANYNRRAPAQAIYLLGAVLREAGYQVKILDHALHDLALENEQYLEEKLNNFDHAHFLSPEKIAQLDSLSSQIIYTQMLKYINDVECVGISANSLNWVYAVPMIFAVKMEAPDLPVIIGGPHATFLPEHILSTTPADYVVRGEGEITILELLAALKKKNGLNQVLGISYKENGKIRHNPDRPPLTIAQMEAAPYPAYEYLPEQQYSAIGVETARGCLHNCKFCGIPFRKSWRGLSSHSVLKRIQHAQTFLHKLTEPQNGKYEIIFLDDNTAQDTKRASEILAGLVDFDYKDVAYTFETRVNNFFDSDFLYNMTRLSFHRCLIGVESGYDEGLRMVGKGLSLRKIEECAQILFKNGLSGAAKFSFVLGLPWEGKEEIYQTLDFALHMACYYHVNIQLCWHGLFPGSEIWANRVKYGIHLESDAFDSHFFQSREAFFRVCVGISEADVIEIQERLNAHTQIAYLLGSLSEISLPPYI